MSSGLAEIGISTNDSALAAATRHAGDLIVGHVDLIQQANGYESGEEFFTTRLPLVGKGFPEWLDADDFLTLQLPHKSVVSPGIDSILLDRVGITGIPEVRARIALTRTGRQWEAISELGSKSVRGIIGVERGSQPTALTHSRIVSLAGMLGRVLDTGTMFERHSFA